MSFLRIHLNKYFLLVPIMLSLSELEQFVENNRNEDVKKLALRSSSLLRYNLNYVLTPLSEC